MNVREAAIREIQRAFGLKGIGMLVDRTKHSSGAEFDFVRGKIGELMEYAAKVVEDLGKGPSLVEKVKSAVKGEKDGN